MYSPAGLAPNQQQFVSGTPSPEIRQPQITDQVQALEVNAKDLTEIVSRLETKLVSVVQPRVEQNKVGPIPEPVLVPLASKLRGVCSDVRGSVDRLRELCGAIELSE